MGSSPSFHGSYLCHEPGAVPFSNPSTVLLACNELGCFWKLNTYEIQPLLGHSTSAFPPQPPALTSARGSSSVLKLSCVLPRELLEQGNAVARKGLQTTLQLPGPSFPSPMISFLTTCETPPTQRECIGKGWFLSSPPPPVPYQMHANEESTWHGF